MPDKKTLTKVSLFKKFELPGNLKRILYEVILTHELKKRGLTIERQVPISIEYDGVKFDEGFRGDIFVENKLILELKSIESLTKAHKKQVLTYLKIDRV